ncbi:MAG: hypothetical protein AAAB35_01465, partial [Phyllobacterium sp.]
EASASNDVAKAAGAEPGIDPNTTSSISVGGKPKGNNGFGNGDQTAPGGSGAQNNAENATGTKGHGGKG